MLRWQHISNEPFTCNNYLFSHMAIDLLLLLLKIIIINPPNPTNPTQVEERKESSSLLSLLGGYHDYHPLTSSLDSHIYSPRLFHFHATSGKFIAEEILCKHRCPDRDTQFPFLQVIRYLCC